MTDAVETALLDLKSEIAEIRKGVEKLLENEEERERQDRIRAEEIAEALWNGPPPPISDDLVEAWRHLGRAARP